MFRLLTIVIIVSTIAGTCLAQDVTVYVTGKVRASLLTICPWADSYVLDNNSLGEDLFLRGPMLFSYEGARVEIVGRRIDHGDCVVIEIDMIHFLPPAHAFGDLNGDGSAGPVDVIVALNYLLMDGPAPAKGWRSVDLNADGMTNLPDIVRLVNLVYGRGFTVEGVVYGSFPCVDTIGAYPGCKYWIMKNSIPLDTGTVDENGVFSTLLPADRYNLMLYPPESPLPGLSTIDLRYGNVLLPTVNFERRYVASTLYISFEIGVTEDRILEIIGYFGGHITEIIAGPPPPLYVVSFPEGMHFEHAMEILNFFPEIETIQPVEIQCR